MDMSSEFDTPYLHLDDYVVINHGSATRRNKRNKRQKGQELEDKKHCMKFIINEHMLKISASPPPSERNKTNRLSDSSVFCHFWPVSTKLPSPCNAFTFLPKVKIIVLEERERKKKRMCTTSTYYYIFYPNNTPLKNGLTYVLPYQVIYSTNLSSRLALSLSKC